MAPRIEEKERIEPTKLVEQTATMLHGVERSLQALRNDLAVLAGRMPPGTSMTMPFSSDPLSAAPWITLGPAPGGPAFPQPFHTGPGVDPFGFTGRPPTGGAWPLGGASRASGAGGGDGSPLARELRGLPPLGRVPNVDLIDEGNEYVLKVELPGVKKEDLDVMVSQHTVALNARTKVDAAEEGTVLLVERGPVEYRRAIPLPSEVITAKNRATLKDGVLTVRLTKKVPGEGPQRVDVGYG